MWLVVLGFVLGVMIAVPLTTVFWGMAFSIKALSGSEYKTVNGTPKWINRET